jgi:hypothetical protein
MTQRKALSRLIIKQITLILALIHTSGRYYVLQAQDIKNKVYVESDYRPEIADADKIAVSPTVTDTVKLNTPVDYTVLPGRLKSDYALRPIKPAKMVGTPLDKLYNSYLRAGIGNYTSPVVEYSIQNLRSKEYAVGAYAFHKSSHYQQRIVESVPKVPAGYSNTEISGYGKKFYDKVNIMANVGADIHRYAAYGVNPDSLLNYPDIKRKDIKQSYYTVYGKAGVYSTAPDSSALNYALFLKGDYLWDHYKNKEPHVELEGNIGHPAGSFLLSLDSKYDHYKLITETDTIAENLFNLHTALSKRQQDWQVNLAARFTYVKHGDYGKLHFYPDVNLKFKVIDKALMLLLGVSGYLENNTYESVIQENPYVVPGLEVANTNHKYIIYAGLDGYLSSKASYKIEIALDARDSVPYYINDTTSRYNNRFIVMYDNTDLIKYHGELNWEPMSYLGFYLRSTYYSYKMNVESIKPWHKPSFDLTLTASYNFKQKIYADVDFFILGKRYAPDYVTNSPDLSIITLDPVYDLNLKLEYKYSNVFGIFLHFYNLTNKQYYLWNQYPGQRLCVLGGINYKF